MRRSPSGYWANNCYVGASFMSRGECAIRDEIGVGRIMWGADYPHIEGTWPHSVAAMREAFNGCTLGEVTQMIEAGRPSTLFTLLRICEAFDVQPEQLVAGLFRKRKKE